MRILHTVASLDLKTGGPARSVPGLAGAQVKSGVEIFLWAKDVPADYKPPQGVILVAGDLNDCAELMPTIDIVHDHGLWLPLNHQIAKAAKKAGCKRVVSPRGMLEPWALNHKKWKKRLAWWLYQKWDLQSAVALHATAEQEAVQFKHLGLKHPIILASNGVDVIPEIKKSSAPKLYKTALFLSRVHPKKGIPMLIEAWARVMPEGWKMRVVGPDEGGHTQELKQLVADAGLSDSWSFEEPLEGDEKWKAMANADVFILPTYSENFGIVVAESLACGTPVITTTGAPWKGLQEQHCGWWVSPDVESLQQALTEVMALDDKDLKRMGERGKEWVAKEFSWHSIADKVLQGYKAALKG